MPIISSFYGIKIAMFYGDHHPAHIHIFYNEYQATLNIKTCEVIQGKIPIRALKLVKKWTKLNQEELIKNWRLAKNHQILSYIDPLE
ncbi:MAG: hypothetical protein ACD_28C00016G0003 [uncultured bacterium]|nr:MAG: hypothetical protein ACD_28C00016G0003 [uncultured bacterium]KKT74851.1 MAG: hypothetical protein UW70_C0044G0021 [Candidatus Peregrinibacteria bacterium GW2011_GWA2_44_7]